MAIVWFGKDLSWIIYMLMNAEENTYICTEFPFSEN